MIDPQRLLDAVIFNFLIGNNDAHAKNFSLLFGGQTRLAPLYDVLSTAYYPELSSNMAMKLGEEYSSGQIRPEHFDRMAEEAGLAKPMVRKRVEALARKVLVTGPAVVEKFPAAQPICVFVTDRCREILGKFGG